MSELPPEFIKTAMRGEMPDLSLMPPSLLQHFKNNLDTFLNQLNADGMVSLYYLKYNNNYKLNNIFLV